MNVVIIGVGEVGRHVARVLSKEQVNVTLVDKDIQKLDSVSHTIDVATRRGDGADWRLLRELLDFSPDLLLAVTDNDESNLVACTIAKTLGYPRTIARVQDSRYFDTTHLNFREMFQVDHLVVPEILAANDIYKYLSSPGSLLVESFVHGAVQLRTLPITDRWKRGSQPLKELSLPAGMMIGVLHRTMQDGVKKVIFPHGDDVILPGDEVTVIGESETIADSHTFFGSKGGKKIRSVVIVGGSLTGQHLAKILEQDEVHVRLIDKDHDNCCRLAEKLPHCTVIHHDGTDLDLLRAEKVNRADAVVACTSKDEVNLAMALLAREAGCEQVVMMLGDERLSPIVEKLGMVYAAAPRVSAANRILSLVRAEMVSSTTSLYNHQAEVVEIHVSANSKITGVPIAQLGAFFPRDFLFAIIQNRGEILVANGNRVLSPGDSAIVVTRPEHIRALEKVF